MMRQFNKFVALVSIISFLLPGQFVMAAAEGSADDGWKLVWSDEFDGNSLDESKWAYETGSGYNNEEQYYTKENVSVSDGTLKITAKEESKGGYSYTSGRLETITEDGTALFSTKYGRIEARIKLPKGDGLWPAFWMQPVDNEYGNWPLSGEIDIMEARGRVINEVNGAIHFGESRPFNKQINDTYTFDSDTDITEFHTYAVEWKENEIIWYVDGEEYFRASNWYTMSDDGVIAEYPAPFNKDFYLILNLAVGGDYDDGIVPSAGELPATMEVDYVRVYHDVNGYSDNNISMPDGTRDEEILKSVPLFADNNLLSDINFDNINEQIMNIQDVDILTHSWYFTTNKYYRGDADLTKTENNGITYANIDIADAGSQGYSIQLIQQLPLAKGYIYKVKFDAMCPDGNKTIKVKAYGEENYCSSYKAKLTTSMQTYEFSFMMEHESDLEAMLQMNLGGILGDVVIGNVSVIVINNGATAAEPETEKPKVTEPETEAPEVEVPEETEPETEAPEVEVPEETEPETEAPEVDVLEVTEPETEAPEVEVPEETEPETEAPEVDVPEETEPETDTSDAEESETDSNDNKISIKDFFNRFRNWLFKR